MVKTKKQEEVFNSGIIIKNTTMTPEKVTWYTNCELMLVYGEYVNDDSMPQSLLNPLYVIDHEYIGKILYFIKNGVLRTVFDTKYLSQSWLDSIPKRWRRFILLNKNSLFGDCVEKDVDTVRLCHTRDLYRQALGFNDKLCATLDNDFALMDSDIDATLTLPDVRIKRLIKNSDEFIITDLQKLKLLEQLDNNYN